MTLEEVKYKVKCDIPGCKNLSSYAVHNKHFFLSDNLYLCSSCLKELYETIGKVLVPKSPKNILNKNK